jgi:sugar transferase (PEP-CTERM/EpsH1 system associated)
VIYITHRVPYPPDKGDRIRNYHLLRQLARVADVSLACLADEPLTGESRSVLEGLVRRLAIVPVSRARRWLRAGLSLAAGGSLSEGAFFETGLTELLDRWQAEGPADAVVVSASSLVPYLRRGRMKSVPAFVDLVDVDSQKWVDFADATAGPKRLLYRLEGRRLRKLESRLPAAVRGISLVSRAEADVYEAFAGPGTATVATNGVDLDYFAPIEVEADAACAFVGALDYLPNVDASVWFARDVWPLIRQRNPTAEFRLIGRKPTREVEALATLPGVKVVGQVPDVRVHLARAAVAVVPMRLSRGLQNKVLEALAMGKATVAAPPALAALRAEPSRHLLAAKTPKEWADAVSLLLGDPELRSALGRAGRQFVEEHHHWDRCLAPLTDQVLAACRP